MLTPQQAAPLPGGWRCAPKPLFFPCSASGPIPQSFISWALLIAPSSEDFPGQGHRSEARLFCPSGYKVSE